MKLKNEVRRKNMYQRTYHSSSWAEIVKVCKKCGRVYAHDSKGYRKTGRCICGGKLVVEVREIIKVN